MIFEELGQRFRDLLELGRAGVVAALVAASQRLKCNQHEVFFYICMCIIVITLNADLLLLSLFINFGYVMVSDSVVKPLLMLFV